MHAQQQEQNLLFTYPMVVSPSRAGLYEHCPTISISQEQPGWLQANSQKLYWASQLSGSQALPQTRSVNCERHGVVGTPMHCPLATDEKLKIKRALKNRERESFMV